MKLKLAIAASAIATAGIAGAQSVPMPEAELPMKMPERQEARPQPQTNVAKKMPSIIRKLNAGGNLLMGYNRTFQYGNICGNYRLDYDLNQELLFVDNYTQKGYFFELGWIRDGKLCGVTDYSVYDIVDYRYMEMDPFTGEITEDKKIYIQDPITTFYNYLPVYISTAYEPSSDTLYGYTCSETGSGYAFFKAPGNDPQQTMAINANVPYSQICVSLCYNENDGKIYGVNRDNVFVSVDKDGKQTEIMPLNVRTQYVTAALIYVPDDDKFIWECIETDFSYTLKEIDHNAKTMTELAAFDNFEQYGFFYLMPVSSDPAPISCPELDDMRFDHMAGSGTVSYFMPTTYFAGGTVDGTMTYSALVDGVTAGEGTASPGDLVEIDVDGLSRGQHSFEFSVAKGDERSTVNNVTRYVGVDTPLAPESVTFSETRIEWTPVSRCVNGGYLDYRNMLYRVYINDEEIGSTQDTFLDYSLPEDAPYANYTAYVAVDNDGMLSDMTRSESIRFGGPWPLDVEILPTVAQSQVCSAFDLNNDGDTWDCYDTGDGTYAFYSPRPRGEEKANDWLFTPPINFDETDVTYEVSFEVANSSKWYPEQNVGVYLHESLDPRKYVAVVQEPRAFSNKEYITVTQKVAVPSPGTYYVSFFNDNEPYQSGLRIRNIKIRKLSESTDLPMSVANLSAVGASNGELKATVKFQMPEKYLSGNEIHLSENVEVIVVCGDYKVETYGHPGSTQTAEIATTQGFNEIEVISYVNGLKGQGNTVSVFTGIDVPGPVGSIDGHVSDDNLTMTLRWSAPTESENGYYINPDDVDYLLMIYGEYGWEELENLGKGVYEYSYSVAPGSKLATLRLGIAPSTVQGASSTIGYLIDALGEPLNPPFTETFENANYKYGPIRIINLNENYYDAEWGVVNPRLISPDMANPSEMSCYGRSETPGSYGMLMLPKFSTKDEENPGIVFTFWTGSNSASTRILAECYDSDGFVEIGKVPSNGNGWEEIKFPLPTEFCDKGWVAIYVDSYFADAGKYCLFSDYTVRGDVSGIESLTGLHGEIKSVKGGIDFMDLEGEVITVYGLDGKVVRNVKCTSSNMTIMLTPGTYVVKAGYNTVKIAVR